MQATAMEPTLPDDPGLRAMGEAVARAALDLGRGMHPTTLGAVRSLLRTVNCYYSNLIEGHDTHPIDIERALQGEYAPGTELRNLQQEARAHVEVQLLFEAELTERPELNVCLPEVALGIHREFYNRLPATFRVVRDPATGREEPVVSGAIRAYDVRVGHHIAPGHGEVAPLLDRFARVYDPAGRSLSEGLVTLAAAHHRLLWIHPFGDGNGRVTRLMTELYLRRLGLPSAGLWSISRGLARRREEYKRALAAADAERWNDYDGRGPLSHRALVAFCQFMLDVAQDQMTYMGGLLRVEELDARAATYGKSREVGLLKGMATGKWEDDETRLLRDLVSRGTIARRDVPGLLRLPERSARRVVRLLTDEGFIASPTSRAPLELRLPAHAAPHLLPGLYQSR
jgi:Fic family protein